jgi:RNA polymerase sigma factor (sigma-70 family)
MRGLREDNRLLAMSTAEERFTQLFDDHFEAVRRYLWRRSPSICDDILAETFLVAWRRLDHVPDDARPWLIAVARNMRLNALRGEQRQQALADELTRGTPQGPAESSDPRSELVANALSMLSEKDQEVLLLAAWDDLDRAAIATVLECSSANVAVRLHRARRRLTGALASLLAGDRAASSPQLQGGVSDVC